MPSEISQELAHKAGVERSDIGKIERGRAHAHSGAFPKIAKALGVIASYLIRESEFTLPKRCSA
jgi:transcriptional regulator with XRE-family HTH domain